MYNKKSRERYEAFKFGISRDLIRHGFMWVHREWQIPLSSLNLLMKRWGVRYDYDKRAFNRSKR